MTRKGEFEIMWLPILSIAIAGMLVVPVLLSAHESHEIEVKIAGIDSTKIRTVDGRIFVLSPKPSKDQIHIDDICTFRKDKGFKKYYLVECQSK